MSPGSIQEQRPGRPLCQQRPARVPRLARERLPRQEQEKPVLVGERGRPGYEVTVRTAQQEDSVGRPLMACSMLSSIAASRSSPGANLTSNAGTSLARSR